MHVFLALVSGRGIEEFTLSNRCKLQSAHGGRLSLCLVDPKSLEPSRAQSLVLRSSISG